MQERILPPFFILLLLGSGCSPLTPASKVQFRNYTVQKGDSIYALGRKFGIPSHAIVELNDLSEPEEIEIGQVLMIPATGEKNIKAAKSKAPAKKKQGEDRNIIPRDEGSIKSVRLSGARKYIGSLNWPVTEGRVISRFGRRWFKFHEGLDIAAEEGSPVYAAHGGKVVYAGNGISGYGNLIVLKSDGILTVYGHNEKNLVRRGQMVKAGEKIAQVGQTGHAYGPHLHFEARVKDPDGLNAAVDPLVFYKPAVLTASREKTKKVT